MRRGSRGSFQEDPDQLPLPLGLPPRDPGPPLRVARGDPVFFTVQPGADAKANILAAAEDQRRRLGLTGRLRPPGVLHVSLNGVGRHPGLTEADLAKAKQAASAVAMAPFDLTFDRLQRFKGEDRRAVVLRCGDGSVQLAALQKALGRELIGQGLHPGFNPGALLHMTVLYDETVIADVVLDTPIVMPVRDVVLVRSLYGQGRYVELGRWPLRA